MFTCIKVFICKSLLLCLDIDATLQNKYIHKECVISNIINTDMLVENNAYIEKEYVLSIHDIVMPILISADQNQSDVQLPFGLVGNCTVDSSSKSASFSVHNKNMRFLFGYLKDKTGDVVGPYYDNQNE